MADLSVSGRLPGSRTAIATFPYWVALGLGLLSCSREARPVARDSGPAVHCYRSSHSVLLGPPTAAGQQGAGPGWLRLTETTADSGTAELEDANGKRLQGRWTQQGTSTLAVVAFDDFLRVEFRLSRFGGGIAGEAKAHSDVTLEPDATGRVGELRRTWPFAAERLPCETIR